MKSFAQAVRLAIRPLMYTPSFTPEIGDRIGATPDPVRYAAIALAMETIKREGIAGDLAECGVWRGHLSAFIHKLLPDRKLYLFDTFAGFPDQDKEPCVESLTNALRDTSVQLVLKNIGDAHNVEIRAGYFPETAKGLEGERFAFVMLDFDLAAPTLAGLNFFYERVTRGGYIFIHDFNNTEWKLRSVVETFLRDKEEKIIEFPDNYGSAAFRKT